MKYIVRYTLDGTYECEASSPEEAQSRFESLSKAALAELADLVADPPKAEAEYEAEIERIVPRH